MYKVDKDVWKNSNWDYWKERLNFCFSTSTLEPEKVKVMLEERTFRLTIIHHLLFTLKIWVSSPHNATGYYTVYGEEALHADHFNTKLSFGDTQTVWARTGYLGFLRRTELTDASGGESGDLFHRLPFFSPLYLYMCFFKSEINSLCVCVNVSERHDALYVVGSLDETLELRGMRYHPIDIETSVIRSHKSIAEW